MITFVMNIWRATLPVNFLSYVPSEVVVILQDSM